MTIFIYPRAKENPITSKKKTGVKSREGKKQGAKTRVSHITEEEGRELLAKIHSGMSGHHDIAQALVSKAFRARFYWPTTKADAQTLFSGAPATRFLPTKVTCPPRLFGPFRSPGLSRSGGLTWSVLSKEDRRKTNTYSSW
jgi:hypothetical protein